MTKNGDAGPGVLQRQSSNVPALHAQVQPVVYALPDTLAAFAASQSISSTHWSHVCMISAAPRVVTNGVPAW